MPADDHETTRKDGWRWVSRTALAWLAILALVAVVGKLAPGNGPPSGDELNARFEGARLAATALLEFHDLYRDVIEPACERAVRLSLRRGPYLASAQTFVEAVAGFSTKRIFAKSCTEIAEQRLRDAWLRARGILH